MSDQHPIEAEARRLAGGAHARGAIPARFWRTAIDAVAHDHDPQSCGECREDVALRFGAAPRSEDAAYRGNASIVITVCPHSVDTRFNTCLLCEKDAFAPQPDPASHPSPGESAGFDAEVAALAAIIHARNDHDGPIGSDCGAMAEHLIAQGYRYQPDAASRELREAAQAVLAELDIIRAHRDDMGLPRLLVHPITHEALRAALARPALPALTVERLAAAMYADGCITPPQIDHAAHVLALLDPQP